MNTTLVVLAAGSGQRFGGDKQTAGVGPHGESLLDYAVYDALLAGFSRLVFVVRPNLRQSFESEVSNRFDQAIEVRYAEQDEPLGTGHALLCARDQVDTPFLVINADDYYGRAAYRVARAALTKAESGIGALISYRLADTLSPHGPVNRGVCNTAGDGTLTGIEEHTQIHRVGTVIMARNRQGQPVELTPDTPVSMNCWALPPSLFGALQAAFDTHQQSAAGTEFYLPDALWQLAEAGDIRIRLRHAPGQWLGMTYAQDRAAVTASIAELVARGDYPAPLWQPPGDAIIRALGPRFALRGQLIEARRFGNGLINHTWRAGYARHGQVTRVIHQQINRQVFTRPPQLMQNMARVIEHLQQKTAGEDRACLRLHHTPGGLTWVTDDHGEYWRTFDYIDDSFSVDAAPTPAQAFEAARAFACFHAHLSDLPGPTLHETIGGFHDTPARLAALEAAATHDPVERKQHCRDELHSLRDQSVLATTLTALLASGKLPERVVHNDTKLNNVLFDHHSGRALCVVDLDTVMPGTVLWDFGDLVRSATISVPEDAADSSSVPMDLDRFEAITRGYLDVAGGWLTTTEKAHLASAGAVMTYELALRFLTDHLEGDVYFMTEHPQHNLQRCRVQLALLKQMQDKAVQLDEIVERCLS